MQYWIKWNIFEQAVAFYSVATEAKNFVAIQKKISALQCVLTLVNLEVSSLLKMDVSLNDAKVLKMFESV